MKSLILAALIAFTIPAQARPLARTPNSAGGYIVITDDTVSACTNETHVAYTVASDGQTKLGCWSYDSLYIHIYWLELGRAVSYNLEGWQVVEEAKP